MGDSMKTGMIWAKAKTFTVHLFSTIPHYDTTVHVLDGEWKEKENTRGITWDYSITIERWRMK